jgi:small subunit ribosomal protein S8
VDIPASKLKKAISQILLEKNFISGFTVLEDTKQNVLRINLKYHEGKPVITGLRRISKPGIRSYGGAKELPRVLGGLGIAIVSTSKGVMTDVQAKKNNVGGEILAYVW